MADRAGFEPTSPALMAAYLSELGRAARAALSSGRPCDRDAPLRLVARIGEEPYDEPEDESRDLDLLPPGRRE